MLTFSPDMVQVFIALILNLELLEHDSRLVFGAIGECFSEGMLCVKISDTPIICWWALIRPSLVLSWEFNCALAAYFFDDDYRLDCPLGLMRCRHSVPVLIGLEPYFHWHGFYLLLIGCLVWVVGGSLESHLCFNIWVRLFVLSNTLEHAKVVWRFVRAIFNWG